MALKDDYYTVSEAAKRLKVSRQTISRWLNDGRLHSEKVGRERLINKKHIWEIELGVIQAQDIIWHELFRIIIEEFGYIGADSISRYDISKNQPGLFITKPDGSTERLVFDTSRVRLVFDGANKYHVELPFRRFKPTKIRRRTTK